MIIKGLIEDFISIVFPTSCVCCGTSLVKGEEFICLFCKTGLPVTKDHLHPSGKLYQKFWGKIKVSYVISFLKFVKGNHVQKILYEIKYRGNKELAVCMGRMYGKLLHEASLSDKFDLILPVPLHRAKLRRRGFNQSEAFAFGLAQSVDVEMNADSLIRIKNNKTQTRKSRLERWYNVEDIFSIKDEAAIRNQRVLIVDDVITTGATLEACCQVVLDAGAKDVSVASMASADN
ncbi:MAG: ComF family protein [Cytophagaceae bacterium]